MSNRARAMKPNAAQIKTDWTARGCGCEYWIDPSDQTWADFVRDVE